MAVCPKIFTRAEDRPQSIPAAQDKSEETKINTTLQLMSTQFLRISQVAVDFAAHMRRYRRFGVPSFRAQDTPLADPETKQVHHRN